MSTSESSAGSGSARSGTLRVVARNDLTEVRVYDASFAAVPLLAGNSGEVVLDLKEGIYQAAFREGTSWEKSEPVLLRAGREIVIKQDAQNIDASYSEPMSALPTSAVGSIGDFAVHSVLASAPVLESALRSTRSREQIFAREKVSSAAVLTEWENFQDLDDNSANVTLIIGSADAQRLLPCRSTPRLGSWRGSHSSYP